MSNAIWLSFFLRSGVILGAAELLRLLLRRSDPAFRHRVTIAAFGCLLAWPLLALAMPEIDLPLWIPHVAHPVASVSIDQRVIGPLVETRAFNAPHWVMLLWIGGVLLALAPVALGHLRLFWLTRTTKPASDPALTRLLETTCREMEIKKCPELLLHPNAVMPLTFGLRRRRILLPAESLAWSLTRQRSVMLHELAHVKRRDLVAQLFANVVTAIWWFQPLSWRHRWLLRRESECACDALVLASGIRASDYASELLAIAHEFRRGQRWSVAAITMARAGELEERLQTILDRDTKGRLRKPSIAVIAILAVFTVTASAVNLVPQADSKSKGGLQMKHTLLSGLLASASLSAATISGSLFDPSGAVIPGAKALLYNPDTAAKQEAKTASDGKFTFENLPAGPYILRIEKPGFASLFREFNVREDSKVERGLTLNLGPIEQQVNIQGVGKAAENSQTPNVQQIRVGGEVEQSNLTTKVQPLYPAAAKAAGVQGKVVLETVISTEGVPRDIRVMESPSDDLTQSALEAVHQWRYTPTLLNGRPVEVVTQVLVNYTLEK